LAFELGHVLVLLAERRLDLLALLLVQLQALGDSSLWQQRRLARSSRSLAQRELGLALPFVLILAQRPRCAAPVRAARRWRAPAEARTSTSVSSISG